LTTQGRFSWEKSSASPIVGRATLTIEASSTTTNCAEQSRISASQRFSLKSCEAAIGLVPQSSKSAVSASAVQGSISPRRIA
jgi:hypothetical protein